MAIGSEIDFLANFDFQMSNLWDFIIIDNPLSPDNLAAAAESGISTAVNTVSNTVFGTLMKFRVTQCNLPTPGLEMEATKIGKKHYKAKEWEGDFTISVLEDTQFSAYNYFYQWLRQIYDFDKNVWLKNPPVRTGILTYFAGDLIVPTAVFTYNNLKIRKIADLSQVRTESNPLTLTINLTFEKLDFLAQSNIASSILNNSLAAINNIG